MRGRERDRERTRRGEEGGERKRESVKREETH